MTTPNDSSTGGYLAPTSSPIAEDTALDAIFQSLVVGITGLAGPLVRPRWQQQTDTTDAPSTPGIGIDWCAIGVMSETPDDNANAVHYPGDETHPAYDEVQRHVLIEVMASFFGPNSRSNANLLRDGLYIGQNREPLFLANMALYDTDPIRNVPDPMNLQWRRRADLMLRFKRQVTRTWPILNLERATGTIAAPYFTEPFDTANAETNNG